MKESIFRELEGLQDTYPIKVKPTDNGFEILLANGEDKLRIVDEGFECILYGQAWHKHCETAEELRQLLNNLFTGKTHVVVKFRGEQPVGYQLRTAEGDRVSVSRWIGKLFTPFWRRKRFVSIRFLNADRQTLTVEPEG